MKVCNQCQAINADGAQFCCKCGAPLGESQHGGNQRGNYKPQQPQYQQQYQQQPQYQQQYQQQPQYQQNMPKPDNKMVWAILTTLFCCLPFGIMAIINASKVDGLYSRGDYAGAQAAADDAGKYVKYSVICGVIVFVIYFFIGVASAM